MSAKKIAILGLLHRSNWSVRTIQEILDNDQLNWQNPHQLLEYLNSFSKSKSHQCTIGDVRRMLQEGEMFMERYKQHTIYPVGQWEELYPQALKRGDVAPPVLFIQGDISNVSALDYIALVGARDACSWSEEIQKRLAYLFVERGYGIVSGLAKGLDTAAHIGCLEAGGRTIAVLAHGFGRVVYPVENQRLAQDIIDKGGCLISMYGWGSAPTRKRFLERNTIQIGLSRGLAYTAASNRGGTAFTVRYAQRKGIPIGFFFHERRTWYPRELNDRQLSEKMGFRLSSRRDIELFFAEISRGET